AWATDQVDRAHFALSDMAGKQFHSFERFSRGAAGLAGVTVKPLRVWLEDWFAVGVSDRVGDDADLQLRLHADTGDIAVDLRAESTKPVVLQGQAGLSRKSAERGNASYYYSATRLSTAGTIRIGARRFAVQGFSWMDREWATSALDQDQTGWDWFALQLNDGHELMFYQLRRQDGQADRFSAGTLVLPDGSTQTLTLEDIELEARGHWQSPRTGARYPLRWRLHIPAAALRLEIEPYLNAQEHVLSVRYWEGAVRVVGTSRGAPVEGSGYLELVGYTSPALSGGRRSSRYSMGY
ncbi:MAG: lipocalin family protein, partial [Acidiferrobacterales bacterium]